MSAKAFTWIIDFCPHTLTQNCTKRIKQKWLRASTSKTRLKALTFQLSITVSPWLVRGSDKRGLHVLQAQEGWRSFLTTVLSRTY